MIVAVCNQKGGVGKTAVTLGLAQAWAALGASVLVVDADPQATATKVLGVGLVGDGLSINDVWEVAQRPGMSGCAGSAIIEAGPDWSGVMVLPSERALAGRDADLGVGRESRLRTALAGVGEHFDVVLIDCPPNLGLITINALVAADQALIVTEARAASVDGIAEMISTIVTVRDYYHSGLELAGVVVNKYIPRRKDAEAWLAVLDEMYAEYVIPYRFPAREVVAVSATACTPITGAPDVLAQFSLLATHLERNPAWLGNQ